MTVKTDQDENLQLLVELEQRVSSLLEDCDRLAEENQMLRQQQEKLSLEKAELQEKHRQVHSKIESMLGHLKTLEQR